MVASTGLEAHIIDVVASDLAPALAKQLARTEIPLIQIAFSDLSSYDRAVLSARAAQSGRSQAFVETHPPVGDRRSAQDILAFKNDDFSIVIEVRPFPYNTRASQFPYSEFHAFLVTYRFNFNSLNIDLKQAKHLEPGPNMLNRLSITLSDKFGCDVQVFSCSGKDISLPIPNRSMPAQYEQFKTRGEVETFKDISPDVEPAPNQFFFTQLVLVRRTGLTYLAGGAKQATVRTISSALSDFVCASVEHIHRYTRVYETVGSVDKELAKAIMLG